MNRPINVVEVAIMVTLLLVILLFIDALEPGFLG